ncbi:heparinase II/III family protein [Halocynthiibacter sp. SDUM655004]|uniref:Heparinase II/III family protein n=2 Tax=Paracoccaceae TaxID=31989 RepID=A0AAE3J0W5_9RHOB|nr:heparinase II/III family protein [Halocynthiibacter halioticoli]MCW4058739.1 heparinase II/III family protein [Halocynthiibacter sp. SDUM655004]
MANTIKTNTRRKRFADRFHARLSVFSRPATGFVSQPEPRTIGSFARGRQLIAGNFMFAGFLVEAPNVSIWELPSPDRRFEQDLHGFTWMDDLAAVGDGEARKRVQAWTNEWIERYSGGTGSGWTPDITGRRVIRWINHALFFLNGQDAKVSQAFFGVLAQQTVFLSRRWHGAAAGLARFEALTGLLYAGLSLTGMERHVKPAMKALARECVDQIDTEGGIPTRNPEELLEVFTLLTWAASALSEAGRMPAREHLQAIERIAPTLRALRHSDGGLARFHGGGRGLEGRLDNALATSGVRAQINTGLSMGFARMHAGRTSIVIDAASPPMGVAAPEGHASTLAFELTSGRRPLVVNCGSGATFGESWRRAGRATPSHSTVTLDGFSSARLGKRRMIGGHQLQCLESGPNNVVANRSSGQEGVQLSGEHDGYLQTHGLVHQRHLDLSFDGRGLSGTEVLLADTSKAKRRFDVHMDSGKLSGIPYSCRFHLHPDVDAEVDMGGTAVSLALKSGEIWVFRHNSTAKLTLEPSVYLEKTRLKPRAAKQIVLSGRAMDYATRVTWHLAKAQDTPSNIRDVEPNEMPKL